MEMAAAHGLAQRLAEMSALDNFSRNQEVVEFISEEDKIIKAWYIAANHQIFHKVDFFYLLRETLIFILSNSPLKEHKKKELLKVVSMYFNTFSNVLKSSSSIRKPVIDIILDPWKNTYFSWEEFFQKKITVRDLKVQEYFYSEPEEIVMARVHVFLKEGKEDMAMTLAKNSFFFHSRFAKNFSSKYQQNLNQRKKTQGDSKSKQGTASMDWYLFILQKKKSLPFIISEMKKLSCHEGILLVQRLRQNKKIAFAFALLQILFMQELVRPSKFCCTKKIFYLWCIMHKEKKSTMEAVLVEIRKIVAMHAPSSAHFYLLVDTLWKQFGSSFISVYVELYVRGLTVDINHLEAAKNGETQDDVTYLESHIASMFAKLSTLFSDIHEGAARECMFSAFSLKPTKERLYILQSLTHSILSSEASCSSDYPLFQECFCVIKCSGPCSKIAKEYFLEHPLLTKGISNVPYSVVKDLVSVLEGVRCISFQYNLFDWHNNATDLGDYLRDFNLAKSWESDTEYASDGSNKSDNEVCPTVNEPSYQSTQMEVEHLPPSAKRKSESVNGRELFASGENVEVPNTMYLNKKIKVQDQTVATNEISKHILKVPDKVMHNYRSGMEDAIENVIRMTLDSGRQNSSATANSSGHNINLNNSLNHANDGTENISLPTARTPVSDNHVYPYSLTTYGKTSDLHSNPRTVESSPSVKSSFESNQKYVTSFTSKHSTLSQALTAPVVSRKSVISPAVKKSEKIVLMQQQSYKQVAQNKFYPVKTVSSAHYSVSKDISTCTVDQDKNISLYQQEALNLGSKNNQFNQARNMSNRITQTSQFVSNQTSVHMHRKSDTSSMNNVSNNQFLSNTSAAPSSSVPSPAHVIQSKETIAAQHAGYPSSSQFVSNMSSMYRTDSSYQLNRNSVSNTIVKRVEENLTCFQDSSLVQCDRSSVIQHTMQHLREGCMQPQSNIEIPNQLTVSLKSNAVEQIRNVPRKEITNLPPFTVNVNDRSISNSSVALSANLVIPKKTQVHSDVASQPVSSTTPVHNSETITIPGILASQSVIVSPWEQQRRNHGDYKFTKNNNSSNPSSIDKRIIKNRPIVYGKQTSFRPEPKIAKPPSRKSSNTHAPKALPHPSHIGSALNLAPSNQNNPRTSQVSSHGVAQPTSSQPWYSEPYPKPNIGSNASSKNVENQNCTIQQNAPATSTSSAEFTKRISDIISEVLQSPAHLLNNPSVSSTASHLSKNFVSSSASSVLNNNDIYSLLNSNPCAVSKENNLYQNLTTAKHHAKNISSFSESNALASSSSALSDQANSAKQLSTSTGLYTIADPQRNPHNYSRVPSREFSPCCSPSEVNPCQNCSLPAENNLVQMSDEEKLDEHQKSLRLGRIETFVPSLSEKDANNPPQDVNPGLDKMIPDNYDALTLAAPCDSAVSNKNSSDGFVHTSLNLDSTLINCQYCSLPCTASDLGVHILNSHSENLNVKNNSFGTEIDPDLMVAEDLCLKSLPLVPEQDSMFQKESFHNDLPHSKTFVNSVVNQQNSIDEIDASAFSACMDLINSDKDLKMIVQGIDTFQEMGNEYLPYIPPNPSASNFLNPNLCQEVQDFSPEAPLQNSNFNQNYDLNHFAEGPVTVKKEEADGSLNCVFDFTEKEFGQSKPLQKSFSSKPKSALSEKSPAHTSKLSNELSFSALAEMIKETMTGDTAGLPIETVSKNMLDDPPVITEKARKGEGEFSCPVCTKILKSPWSLKRHLKKLHPDSPIDNSEPIESPKLTNLSQSFNVTDSSNQFMKDLVSQSQNSYNDSNESLNPVLSPDIKFETASTSEMYSPLPKGRVKGIIKSPTVPCKLCGKVLTSMYMKKHILSQHPEQKKVEDSSSDLNMDANVSSPTQVESGNTPTLPSLLEQDIDSSTCLSVSDALKRNNTYSVADNAKFSNSNDKLTDDNVKFNFNVLEFSKDTKRASNASNFKNASLKLKQPPPDKASKLEGVNAKNDKQESINKHSCHICPKAYANNYGLRRHLKAVHDIMVQKSIVVSKQNKKVAKSLVAENEVKNVELQQSQLGDLNKVSDSVNESLKTANSKAPICSLSSPVENISPAYDVASVDFKTKDRYKNKSPSVNKSLLRAVLKSNFESKQREIKDLKESAEGNLLETCSHKETHVCDTLVNESNHDKQLLYPTPCSNVNNNYESVDDINLHLNSENKISTSVPLDSFSETPLAESSVACSSPVQPDAEDYLSSTLPKFDNSDAKELNEIDKDLQDKYSTFPYSQNLSLQSSEISPISEIISNVSKCHFGGTSNVDSKEFFEDNSLKLLIPENQDESDNCYESALCQSSGPKLIQLEEGKMMNTVSVSDKITAGEIGESSEKSYMPELIKEQPSNDDVLKEERNNMNISLESMNSLSIYPTDVHDLIKNEEIEEQGVLNVNGCISTESVNGENNRLDPSALIQHQEIDERQISGDYCVNSSDASVLASIKQALQSQQFIENEAEMERINCSPIVVKSIDENDEKRNVMIEENLTNTFNESIQDNKSTHKSEVVQNQEIDDGKFLMEDYSSSNVSDKSTGFDDSINKDNESTHESEVIKDQETNSGKFLMEENSSSNVSDKSTGFDDSKNSTQTSNKPLEDNSTNISGKSDSSFKNGHDSTADESFKSGEEISTENSEMAIINDTEKNSIKCRLCHQNLQSMEILSMHLEEVHDVPFLTKEVSSPRSTACFQEPSKLSPPKLRPNESDSESVSDLDNPYSLSKTMNYSSELDTSDNLCAIPSLLSKHNGQEEETILQNSQSKFKMSRPQLQQPEKEAELCKSESSTFPLSCTLNSDSQTVTPLPRKFSTRRHSLSGSYSVFSQGKNSVIESENSFLGSKRLSLNESKVKSTSLPNLKLSFGHDNPNTALSADSVSVSSNQDKHQSGEAVCFNNGSEVDEKPGSPSPSHNVSLKWPKITIRTNFSLTSLLRSNNTSGHKLSERKKLSQSSIILSRLKTKSSKKIKKEKELKKKIKHLSCDENSEIKNVKELKKKIKHLSCHENSEIKKVKELKKKIKHLSCHENSEIKNVKELKKKIKHLSCHENSEIKNVKGLKKKIKHLSCHENSEAKSKFKPIIITFREAAEISEFLKTHKQPFVKLVRLKEENIYSTSINQKTHPIPNKTSSAPNNQKTHPIPNKTSSAPNNQKTHPIPDKTSSDYAIKKAVVKLERIPSDEIPKLVIVNQNLSPNSLSQETHITAIETGDLEHQTAVISDDFSIHSQNADTSHSENSLTCKYHPLEEEEITTLSELDTSSSSSDSVQFLEIVRKDPRSRARARTSRSRKKFCTSPLMKKCLVVLKRI